MSEQPQIASESAEVAALPSADAIGSIATPAAQNPGNGVSDAEKLKLSDSELEALPPVEFASRWRLQEAYVTRLEQKVAQQEGDRSAFQQRERTLVRRLAAKEHELHDCVCQLAELKSTAHHQRTTLLDPAANTLLQLLRQELSNTRVRLEETQNELSAWKFTPDSNTGKRLMAKCRLLYQENEELGKMTSSGRLAKLEGELALHKSFCEEVKKSQQELDTLLQDLDEDVEGMQSTICYLQQELRKSRDTIGSMQAELSQSRATTTAQVNGSAKNASNEDDSEPELVIKVSEREESLLEEPPKKARRSSVLSLDYHDDDDVMSANDADNNLSDAE